MDAVSLRAGLILMVVVTLTLAGCPFSSDLPLSSPADALPDDALTGRWKTQDKETRQWVTVEFLQYSEKEYVAWSRDPGEASGKIEAYRVFVTNIERERFLNIQELGPGTSRVWSFANYHITGDALSLRFVDDALFSTQTFSSSDALREFVRKNLRDPRLYASDDGKESVMNWQRVTN